MKRSEALRSLSREHHAALTVAKALQEAESPASGREQFLAFWEPAGRLHFRLEEEVLLPLWTRWGTVDREQTARMLDEHLDLRARGLELDEGAADLEAVHELGALLHDHVRFEERELFPAVEAGLDAAALERLGAAIAAARALPTS